MTRRIPRIMVIVGLALLAMGVLAQTDTDDTLIPEQPVLGSVTEESLETDYQFTAEADTTLVIEMNAVEGGTLDPHLVLIGPNGIEVTRDDDGGEGRNARIETTLKSSGIFTVVASRYPQGSSIGDYRLTLTILNASGEPVEVDPLSVLPSFGVEPAPVEAEYQERLFGTLDAVNNQQYYAVVGQQGDLIRVIMTTNSGNLSPEVDVLNQNLISVTSTVGQARPTESIAFATLPETGWYLISARATFGIGAYNLFIDRRLTGAVVRPGEEVTGEFTPGSPTVSYVFNARIGDLVSVNLFTPRYSEAAPQLCLLDVRFDEVAPCEEAARFVTVSSVSIPRSGAYILQATNRNPEVADTFSLRLTTSPIKVDDLTRTLLNYNEQRRGFINDNNPVTYYQFTGKVGERVTISMTRTSGDLDPFLILSDGDLTEELTFNDNVSATTNARIVQYALQKDANYFILATRGGLANGTTSGGFDIALTAGDVSLEPGSVSVQLRWESAADLNLYVKGPRGRTVSSSNPDVPSGGRLDIDSNAGCTTVTNQPIEHIYWLPGDFVTGDYEVWVWYQDACGQTDPAEFELEMLVGDSAVPTQRELPLLIPGQRFETSFRVTGENNAIIVNPGRLTEPTAQQTASQGGDGLISYGDVTQGTIDNRVFAHFYQFNGSGDDRIRISVDATDGDLDPIVILRNADDQNLPDAINDDVNLSTRNAELEYTLPEDGQYIVAVTRFGVRDGTTTGDYELLLERLVEEQPGEAEVAEAP
jgi:hypothetical protein